MQATFSIKDGVLMEFDQEMATTRRLLEIIPTDKLGWKPHSRSMSMGALGTHLAVIPAWVSGIIRQDGYDMKGGEDVPAPFDSTARIVEVFDTNVAGARAAIHEQDDSRMLSPWTFSKRGRPLFTAPRVAALRMLLLSHVIHHRGQLSVYLRLHDVPLPAIYGPTADTGW